MAQALLFWGDLLPSQSSPFAPGFASRVRVLFVALQGGDTGVTLLSQGRCQPLTFPFLLLGH